MGPSRARAGLAGLLAALVPAVARADHEGPLRAAPMSPLMVGVVAGALALVSGLLVVVIVMLISRRSSPSE
ncbi:MAG TPA: hypothetical protein VFO18_00940 [Methylomirabilota bacterium]|nr:hypothetical protein [Methylomirabilota bacterium]